MRLILRSLTVSDAEALEKAMSEAWEREFSFLPYFDSLANSLFDEYIKLLPHLTQSSLLPKGHVPCTLLFAFNQSNELVGRVSIRHELNEALSRVGGHIGYGVVPSHRRKGYATEILKEALSYTKTKLPKIKKVLITCDDDNTASIKTIEKNNGILINKLKATDLNKVKRRYLIYLRPHIRRALPADAPGIHLAHMESIQTICSHDYTQEEILAWGHRPYKEEQRLQDINNDLVWVIEDENRVEGFGHLRIYEDKEEDLKKAHLMGLYLTERVKGKGLGKAIFTSMKRELQRQQIKTLSLESTLSAHDFYSKLGFVDEGAMTSLKIGGTPVRCFKMKLAIETIRDLSLRIF